MVPNMEMTIIRGSSWLGQKLFMVGSWCFDPFLYISLIFPSLWWSLVCGSWLGQGLARVLSESSKRGHVWRISRAGTPTCLGWGGSGGQVRKVVFSCF